MASILKWRGVAEADPISGIIKCIERGGVISHIEFLTDDEQYAIGARALGGVARRPCNYEKFILDIRFRVTVTDVQYDAAWTFLNAQIGKPYDFGDCMGILFNHDWASQKKWMCSRLWVATLETAKIIGQIDENVSFFTPQDGLVVSSAMWPQGVSGALGNSAA